ncbi:caspase domain-containing protein [Hysterangium stoloniferum]|nr:caspase domain-containing protein [Hysterangium stoloniferum]
MLVMDLLPATSCAYNNLFIKEFNICPNPIHTGITQTSVPQTSPSTVYNPIQSVMPNTDQYPPRFHDSSVDQFGHPSQISCKMPDMLFVEVEKTSCQDLSLVHTMDVNTAVVHNPSTSYNLAVGPNAMSIRPIPSSPENNPNQFNAGNTAQDQRHFYDLPIGQMENISQVLSCRMSDALFFDLNQSCPASRNTHVIKLGRTSEQSVALCIAADANETVIPSISTLYDPAPTFHGVLQAAERYHPKTERIAESLKNRMALIIEVISYFLIALVFNIILPGDYFPAWPSHIGSVFGLRRIPRVGRRKAVLVAISYEDQKDEDGESFFLPAPLNELPKMREFLMECWGFAAEDIAILSDDPAMEHIRPTCENILEQLRKLRAGVAPGDLLFFWYNGHGGQVKNENNTESDGFDECIPISYDLNWSRDSRELYLDIPAVNWSYNKNEPRGFRRRYKNIILDDELREILVSPLPAGAHLVALFDSCNSGTMLDLRFKLSLKGISEEPQKHGHKSSSEGHAISISASFDGQKAWQHSITKRSVLTKAFPRTLSETPNQTFLGLLLNLDTLISKDLKGAHKQDPQMGFNYRPNQSDLFWI